MIRVFEGFGAETREYVINGVRYYVNSHFEPINMRDTDTNVSLKKKLEKYIASDFADLPSGQADGKMEAECVCAGCMASQDARKEENYAAEN